MRLMGFVIGVTLVGVAAVLYLRSIQSVFVEHDTRTVPVPLAETQVVATTRSTDDTQALEASTFVEDAEIKEEPGNTKPDEAVEDLKTEQVESPKAEAHEDIAEKHSAINEIADLAHEDVRAGQNSATDTVNESANESSGKGTEDTSMEALPLEVFADSQPQAEITAVIETPSEMLQPSWQAFWKPFHREHSANGFAARLREVTGLDIDVKKQTQGQYIIGFRYTDEAERQRNIDIIENRTGLKLNIGETP